MIHQEVKISPPLPPHGQPPGQGRPGGACRSPIHILAQGCQLSSALGTEAAPRIRSSICILEGKRKAQIPHVVSIDREK